MGTKDVANYINICIYEYIHIRIVENNAPPQIVFSVPKYVPSGAQIIATVTRTSLMMTDLECEINQW